MRVTPQVTYKNLTPSAALSVAITNHSERLEALCDRISSIRVSIEATSGRHRKGTQYHVHIELHVPGKELIVSRAGDEDRSNEDAYFAVREAFRAMKRQLKEFLETRQDFEQAGKDRRWDGLATQ